MPHDVRSPHIFQDGPGNTASGEQVMDNLDAIWAAIDLLMPPGTIRISGGTTPESGWLLCDGAAVSRTTYAALFAKYGTAFGTGDGSTTFNLPDLRGRAPIGAGTGASPTLAAKTLGTKVGTEPSNMPNHAHTIGSSNFDRPAINSAGGEGNIGSGGLVAVLTSTAASGSGSGTDGNVPPSTVVNFFAKT